MASDRIAIAAAVLDKAAGVRHAFFTRQGGVSHGLYASLNCGFGSKDEATHVSANRARAMESLGLPPQALITAYQVHSADVAVVDNAWTPSRAPRADAMVTMFPGVALGVLTADCAPVLFADTRTPVIGAAHAGWRGALAGVVEATVAAMVALGARVDDIVAGVGPCIHQQSYEVGPEFHARFVQENPRNDDFFRPADDGDRLLFDLPGYLSRRLARMGLRAVERLALDTWGEEELFFSHRRATQRGESDCGRGLSAIALASD